MKPRQLNWKWLLLGFAVLVLAAVAIFPRLAGNSAELQRRTIAALSDWAGGEVMLTGPLTVHYFPDVAIKGGFELRDPARLPPVQSIASNDAKLTLDLPALLGGRISIDALRLNNPEIVLKDPAPSAPASQETQAARIANLFAGTHVRTVRLRDGRITLPPSLGGETIDKVQARFAASANTGAMSSFGSFEFRNETVRFALDSAKPAATETGAAVPVGLTLNSLPLVLKFSGNATIDDSLKLDGQLQTEIADARRLFRWSGIALPEGTSLQGLTASGTAHFRGTTLSFDDGVFTLDGNTADGVLSVAMGERPRLEGTFDFERLVLDPYLAGSARPETVQAQGTDLDRVLLNHFDADLRVSAAEIAAAGLKLGRGAFTLSAKGGVLASEIGELELCGGEGTGRIGADLTQQAVKANLAATLTNVSLETCLQPLGLMAPAQRHWRAEDRGHNGGQWVGRGRQAAHGRAQAQCAERVRADRSRAVVRGGRSARRRRLGARQRDRIRQTCRRMPPRCRPYLVPSLRHADTGTPDLRHGGHGLDTTDARLEPDGGRG